MKNNQGITLITLVITVIVIILIASITIYSGLDTVQSIRKKNAMDTTNAVYLALVANENTFPVISGETAVLSDDTNVLNRELTDDDFKRLGLDYTTEKCKIVFSRIIEDNNYIRYVFTYTDDMNTVYDNIEYKYYNEYTKASTSPEFDTIKKVNRPVLSELDMIALNYDGEIVKNTYLENWYNYEKGVSKLATIRYKGKTYAWIPRFAYRIQSFYVGRSYDNVPSTAIDIVFLRDNTRYMSNGEVISNDYTIHPAFANGETGFWIMVEPAGTQNSIANAGSDGSGVKDSNDKSLSHLMKNSEYAAAVFLSIYLENDEIKFPGKEFVAAGCDLTGNGYDNFDIYSLDSLATNYFDAIKGEALLDTPWNLKKESIMPDSSNMYIMRDVDEGGYFYFESSGGLELAYYRMVIPK